jgi:hypothetical protein
MTYETRNLLKSVLELPPKDRELFLTKIYDSLQEHWQKKEELPEAKEKKAEKLSQSAEEKAKENLLFFDELKDVQNQMLSERVEKMNNGKMAYFSVTQLQKKLDMKLNELNLN